VNQTIRVPIHTDKDIVAARQKGRALALSLGFSEIDSTLVATAISELARNIVTYAKRGEIQIHAANGNSKGPCIVVVAKDRGAGISNIKLALQDGFSTSGSLGLGLPGVKRLVDEFEIVSNIGKGTIVKFKKWKA
jgi:serine/threonine-protein kinase RsbT